MRNQINSPVLRRALQLVVLESRLAPATWTGNHGSFWSDPLNWSPNAVPQGEVVVFQALGTKNFTPVVDIPFTIAGLQIDSTWTGSLNVNQPLTITGNSSWAKGPMVLNGNLGASLKNQGTLTFISPGGVSIASGSGDGVFTNEGTVVQASTGGTNIVCEIVNNGVIDVQAGKLILGKATLESKVAGPSVKVASGATLELTGATKINATSITASGGGLVHLKSGVLTLDSDATFDFPPQMFLQTTGAAINLNGRTLTNAGSMRIDINLVTNLDGPGTLLNQGEIIQTGTTRLVITDGTTIVNNGVYDIQCDNPVFGALSRINTGSFQNAGTLRRSAGIGTAQILCNFTLGGTIDVQASSLQLYPSGGVGSIDSATIKVGAGASLISSLNINVRGMIKASGDGTALFNGTLKLSDNTTFDATGSIFKWQSGIIELNGFQLDNSASSTLTFASGGTSFVRVQGKGTLSNDGTIVLASGGLDIFSAQSTVETTSKGLFDYRSDYIASGAGSFKSAGTLRRSVGTGTPVFTCNYDVTGNIDVQTGTLRFYSSGATPTVHDAKISVTTGSTMWFDAGTFISGKLSGVGGGTILSYGTGLALTGDTIFDFPAPMYQWSSGGIDLAGHNLTIAAGSGLTLANASATGSAVITGEGSCFNSGAVVITKGGLNLANAKTIFETTSVGVLDIQANYFLSGPGTLKNSGTLRRSVSTANTIINSVFVNTGGTIDVLTGSLDLPGSVLAPFALGKGTLQGGGTVLAPITNADGFVRPGSSPGKLTVNGGYTQSGTGSLNVELNGLAAGTEYDQLAVIGGVALGGALNPTVGFASKTNDTFVIVDNDSSDAVVGTFAGLAEGATLPISDGTAIISYKGGTGNDVTLKIVTPPTIPQIAEIRINSGDIQRSRVTSMSVRFTHIVSLPSALATAFQLKRQSDDAIVTLAGTVDNTGPGSVVTLSFTGGPVESGSLADGRYTLTASAALINSGIFDGNGDGVAGDDFVLIGNPATNKLFRLFGDADGDGDVDAVNFAVFRLALGGADATFDFDNDGSISAADFIQFRLRFGGSI